ncbi:MAG: ankyrin repeat domain-containing protein [Methyloversatilis sp.]|nr:ankyrin repeat domain-containing protein [Methyloversatilis sp.]
MGKQQFWIAALAGCLIMTTSCAETRVGGKGVHEVFIDRRVAALVAAVSEGSMDAADKALQLGADVNAVGAEGLSPLLWVMGTTLNVSKIEYLLKKGADPNYRDNERQASAMSLAAGGDRADILELLLQYRGDPNLLGPGGDTMLMIAVSQLRDKNLDLLLKYGANLNQTDRHHETVANKAAGYGRYDLVAKFLDIGLDYNLQGLARTVEVRVVPPGSEQQSWKEKVIEMLKARGAKFPAFVPHREE